MKGKYKILGLLLPAVMVLVGLAPTVSRAQEERILSFDSSARVNPDASMTVRETIQVVSTGEKIKHGIYRDFPTRYRDHFGIRTTVPFDVLEVKCDGKPDDYHFDDLSNGRRIYIGKKNVLLPSGNHTYTLVYKTDRQLGFFEEHDELYWNVTGNGWAFPIDKVRATVELPSEFAPSDVRLEGYTGPQGAQGQDFRAAVGAGGKITFTTTKPLEPYEGLTIVVSWPKGLVAEPTRETKIRYLLQDNGNAVAGLLGLAVLLAYYLVVWWMVGKDPQAGTVVTLYEPPDGFSPATMRFLRKMGYDDKVFTAAILDMAVKGWISIREEDGVYTIIRNQDKNGKLAPEESKIISKLLGSRDSLELKQKNHSTIRSAIVAAQGALKTACEKSYFVTNRAYLISGLVLSALASVVMLFFGPAETTFPVIFMCIWLTGWTAAVIFLMARVVSSWKEFLTAGSGRFSAFVAAVVGTLFALPFLGGEVFGLFILGASTSIWVVVFLIIIGAVNVLFHHLLKAPTRMGRQLLDKIEGFRTFLKAVDEDRLNMMYPPDRTPELFEKYLPYALALGVEQQWAEQFTDVLAHAGEGGTAYAPSWYSGHAWNSLGATGFGHSFGGAFSSAVSSSSTAPGSSSGGGGGGSSGGGGGGGGGGGW